MVPQLLLALAVAGPAGDCGCGKTAPAQAKADADIVFRGSITGIENGWVWFRVSTVWKGEVERVFMMPRQEATGSCWGFSKGQLTMGADLVVYASKVLPKPNDPKTAGVMMPGYYVKGACSRTGPAVQARMDLAALGAGTILQPVPVGPAQAPRRKKRTAAAAPGSASN